MIFNVQVLTSDAQALTYDAQILTSDAQALTSDGLHRVDLTCLWPRTPRQSPPYTSQHSQSDASTAYTSVCIECDGELELGCFCILSCVL